MLQTLYDSLVCDEYATVQHAHEESKEFGASLSDRTLLILVAEQVLEIINHGFEEGLDELVAQSRLQLLQKLVAINQLLVVVRQRLLNVHLYLVVEDPG